MKLTKTICALAVVIFTPCVLALSVPDPTAPVDRVIGVVDTKSSFLSLYNSKRNCWNDSLYAEITMVTKVNKKFKGCWVIEGPNVLIFWEDGDYDRIPARAVKNPKPA